MKRILLLLLFIICSSQILLAQVPTQPSGQDTRKFRIGFQVSPEINWTKAKSDNIDNNGTNVGIGLGPTFEYDFTPNYSFFTGVNIENTTAAIILKDSLRFNSDKDTRYLAGTSLKYSLKYIEIPLLIKLKTNEIGYMTYFGQFGISPAINIGAKGDINDITGLKSRVDADMSSNVLFANTSLVVGGGASYSLTSTTSVYGSLNFINGFINFTRSPTGFKTKAILNRLSLMIGVMF